MWILESLCCSPKTNTTLEIQYTTIKKEIKDNICMMPIICEEPIVRSLTCSVARAQKVRLNSEAQIFWGKEVNRRNRSFMLIVMDWENLD